MPSTLAEENVKTQNSGPHQSLSSSSFSSSSTETRLVSYTSAVRKELRKERKCVCPAYGRARYDEGRRAGYQRKKKSTAARGGRKATIAPPPAINSPPTQQSHATPPLNQTAVKLRAQNTKNTRHLHSHKKKKKLLLSQQSIAFFKTLLLCHYHNSLLLLLFIIIYHYTFTFFFRIC